MMNTIPQTKTKVSDLLKKPIEKITILDLQKSEMDLGDYSIRYIGSTNSFIILSDHGSQVISPPEGWHISFDYGWPHHWFVFPTFDELPEWARQEWSKHLLA